MIAIDCMQEIISENQKSLELLAKTISWSQGKFTPILVRCNFFCFPEKVLLQQLQQQFHLDIKTLRLEESAQTLFAQIEEESKNKHPQALMVLGLSNVAAIDSILVKINAKRDNFVRRFPFPIVLWVNDDLIGKIARKAPDFNNICSTISFTCPPHQFTDCIEKVAKGILEKILKNGAGILWQQDKDTALNECKGFLRISQLEAAKRELQEQDIKLTPELEASLEFLLGHSPELPPEERQQHYQKSLQLWRQIGNWRYEGCVLYCLGVLAITYAMQNPPQRDLYFAIAKRYFYHCVRTFDKANCPDLVSKFINALAEGYKRREQLSKLKKVAIQALNLHQNYEDKVREARAKGFLAEVAVIKSEWGMAQKYATEARQILEEILENSKNISPEEKRWEYSFHYGWYLLSLAQSQRNLDQMQEAIKNLNIAKQKTSPQNDPELYIKILNELWECYKESCKYLEAFEIKQERQEVEQQFGFKAFIGAGQLQPRKLVTNPAYLIPTTGRQEKNPVPGRNQEAKLLTEKIQDNQRKLIVIYGPSGGGKSSFITRLIPALEDIRVEGRSTLIVVQKNYQNWQEQLYQRLKDSYKDYKKRVERLSVTLAELKSADIWQALNEINQHNLCSILVFDELEGFFSTNQNLSIRKEFYYFLQELLKQPFVKVVFLLREEYLHYLLECDRQIGLTAIGRDILHNENLQYVGNFDKQLAKTVIQELTQSTAFHLEQDLIDRVVSDLAEESEEVFPFELQLVGSQLEKQQITTLTQYQTYGSFHELVKGYIREVIHDCGKENDKLTHLVLYLLTDEPPIRRPPRSINGLTGDIKDADLDLDLKPLPQIRLILKILVDSGLVTTWQEEQTERYQLIQDYLVQLIRGGQRMQGMVEERYAELPEKVRQTKGELREIADLKTLSQQSQTFLQDNNQLEALLTTVKLGKALTKTKIQSQDINTLKEDTLHGLRQLVYDIQEFNRLERHSNDVYQISFSPDGKTLASASWDKTVKLWSHQGELLQTFEGHEKGVNSVTFSPDGQLLASASGDHTIKLWKLDGTCIKTIKDHTDWVWDVKFSPDGQLLASASSDGTVRLWNLRNENEKIEPLRHEGRVFRVSFSHDGKFLASAGHDRKIKLWERGKNNCYTHKQTIPTNNLENIDDIVYTLRFSPDGQTIAAGGWDKTIKIWSWDGTLLKILRGHEDCINSVRFSPNGQLLASASNDNTVKLWHLEYEICLKTFKGHSNWINSVSFSPNGQLLASAGDDNTIRLWKFEIPLLKSFQGGKEPGHTKKIHGVAVSPSGQFIASASWDGTIKLWNFDGKVLQSIPAHDNWVWDVCVSPDGKTLASAGGDQKVKLWDVETGKELKSEIPKQRACVHSVSFSPDGKSLAFGSDEIRLWQLKDGTWQDSEIFGEQKNRNDIWQVRFSPDGGLLAVASSELAIGVWYLDGSLYKGHTELVNSISFSPDNKLLISAGNDAKLILWDVSQGKIKHWIKGHHARIYSVAFSPNGQIIASASADRTIKLWTLDFTLLRTLEGHTEWVNSICFTPDGNTLISGSSDKTIKLWDVKGIQSNLQEDRMEDPEVSEFDRLLQRGCQWLRDYVTTNQNISDSDRSLLLGDNP
jgi:WD40 repeat protein